MGNSYFSSNLCCLALEEHGIFRRHKTNGYYFLLAVYIWISVRLRICKIFFALSAYCNALGLEPDPGFYFPRKNTREYIVYICPTTHRNGLLFCLLYNFVVA